MLLYELEKLIKSLSASEKKAFQLHSARQQGDKDYVTLYELAVASKNGGDAGDLARLFKERHPAKSLENTAAYLYKVLTDILVQIRIEQDTWYQQFQGLMKARLCFERSIPSRAFKELRKVSKLAAENQHHLIGYQSARMELTALADMGFKDLSEQQLVNMQMKGKHMLQTLRQIHEHYSLYELLSYRLSEGKLAKSAKLQKDKQINDLILSELSLSTRGSQQLFEPQKLHLLFQSFFFIHTGEYRSALRIFNDLTKLIEANEPMWDYPPYDYLSALDGILDSLRSIGYYEEMEGFIGKLDALSNRPYPEHFQNLASLTARAYRLNMLTGMQRSEAAVEFSDAFINDSRHHGATDGHEKQVEWLYFQAAAHFQLSQWTKARKLLSRLMMMENPTVQLAAYRAGRLLHILLSYELDDMEYLEYEIRSYKRAFSKQGKAYRIEKLVFNTIASDPKRRGNARKAVMRKKISTKLQEVSGDKRELQLLKYFDFGKWLLDKNS